MFLLKRIFIFIFTMFLAVTALAKEVSGIGDFVIGMSLSEFMDLQFIKERAVKDKADRRYPYGEMNVWRTTIESNVQWFDSVYSQDIVRFEFYSPVGVSDILKKDSYSFTATFYKDKLAVLRISDATEAFEDVLTSKYGKPFKEDDTRIVVCQNGFGAQSSRVDGSKTFIWGKGKKVTATLVKFFDCGRSSASYIVADKVAGKAVDKIDQDGRMARNAEEQKEKASSSRL